MRKSHSDEAVHSRSLRARLPLSVVIAAALLSSGCKDAVVERWRGVDFYERYTSLKSQPASAERDRQLDELCLGYYRLVIQRPLQTGRIKGVITDARGNRLGYLKLASAYYQPAGKSSIDAAPSDLQRCRDATFDVPMKSSRMFLFANWKMTTVGWSYGPYISIGFAWRDGEPYQRERVMDALDDGDVVPLASDPTQLHVVVRSLKDDAEYASRKRPGTLEELLRPVDQARAVDIEFPEHVVNGQPLVSLSVSMDRFPSEPLVTRVPVDGLYQVFETIGGKRIPSNDYVEGDALSGELDNSVGCVRLRQGD
jgi:hypothetical protein